MRLRVRQLRMSSDDSLQARFPELRRQLARVPLATLPTPVSEATLERDAHRGRLWIKHDNLTGTLYGGNKVRKLEYLFGRLLERKCQRVATFGAVGSNHALATSLYARSLGLEPICFLSHQTRTRLATQTLRMHVANGSELVAFGGSYASRLQTLRTHLWNRRAGVIPMGGSSWLGSIGFVAAGLELAEQIAAGTLPPPDRIYLASGTMGTAAGLALGLALADLNTSLHAVRVSHASIANEDVLRRLIARTTDMLHRMDPAFPANLATRARVVLRHDYFEPGYAHSNAKTDAALRIANTQLGADLEATYTGKALAALIDDWPKLVQSGSRVLFWNTYHAARFGENGDIHAHQATVPREFLGYLG
jgi:D-cysteine desulfhydrase